MIKWYKEPLLHFTILGVILFILNTIFNPKVPNTEKKTIHITKNEIDKLKLFWQKKHNNAPTKKELDNILKHYISNEVLYQKALEMKLDKHDSNIKQILIDKLKNISNNTVNINTVSEEDLKEYFLKNQTKFFKKPDIKMTFGHLYLNPKNHKNINKIAQSLVYSIQNIPYTQSMLEKGDTFYRDHYFKNVSAKKLSKVFSYSFIRTLEKLPERQWSRPLKSEFGVHLVYMFEKNETHTTYNDIKEKVKRTYIIEKNRDIYEKFYENIQKEYHIILESDNDENEK